VRKIFFSLLFIFFITLVIAPYFSGLLIQKNYERFIAVMNDSEHVRVRAVEFQRHWWTTDAVFQIEIISPYLKSLQFSQVIHSVMKVPVVTLKQHVFHGPIFYHSTAIFPYFIGLASIQNTMQTSAEIPPEYSQDMVTLTGKYIKPIFFNGLKINYPDNGFSFSLGNVKGKWILSPGLNKIAGDFLISNFSFKTDEDMFSFSQLQWSFHYKKSESGLWVGKSSFQTPEINFNQSDDVKLSLLNVKMRSVSDEINAFLEGSREITIEKIKLNDEGMGPLYAEASIVSFNAKEVVSLLDAYKKILQFGELYESQLKQKINLSLPKILTAHSEIRLDNFALATPKGKLVAQGAVSWPHQYEMKNSDLSDLQEAANFKLSVRVSKTLADLVIKSASKMPYFFKVTPEQQEELQQLENKINANARQNAMTLVYFVQQGWLSEDAAEKLLDLQKTEENADQYREYLRHLMLKREITLASSYILGWRYSLVTKSIDELEQSAQSIYTNTEKQLRDQFNQWIKIKYVQEDAEDYVIGIRRADGINK